MIAFLALLCCQACVRPPTILYARESGQLVHYKTKEVISSELRMQPEECEPTREGYETCTWRNRYGTLFLSGEMIYSLRCELPLDGSYREPRSCVFTGHGSDGEIFRGPEVY